MTPLGLKIAEMIETDGPMSVERFMALCLAHPDYGYYLTRDPLGAAGDFTTAPEISQVFGELIGVWCVSTWMAMGEPARINLVELGPGRGTLMVDALRASAKSEKFAKAVRVHLVETSPTLRGVQREKILADATWHDHIQSLPAGPCIFIANEFFDALPIQQFVLGRGGRWHERCVGLHGTGFQFGLTAAASPISVAAEVGAILELSPVRSTYAEAIGFLLKREGGALLAIDYGHLLQGFGDTLQAMQNHEYVDVLAEPGAADITSHVDFSALGSGLLRGGAKIQGCMTQGAFLTAMGLQARVKTLAARAVGQELDDLRTAAARLADDDKMGQLFKVMIAAAPNLPLFYPIGQS